MIRFNRRRRAAFTLIELLTVVSIILILASMIVAVAYTGTNKQLTANGSTTLVGWLKTMQAYALRDQKIYGLRLRTDPITNVITSVQYIEQPDEYLGPLGSTITVSTATPGGPITATGSAGPPAVDFSGGLTAPQFGQADWPVRVGDFLEIGSSNNAQIAVITGVSASGSQLTCAFPPGDSTAIWGGAGPITSNSWRIVRQPRPMVGADVLSLPAGVAINPIANTNINPQSPLPPTNAGNTDIMFSPSGAVVTSGFAARDIRLWVVDTTQPTFAANNTAFDGNPLIVTIAVRTGLISVQPVGPIGTPYLFVQDGKSSGY